MADMCRLPAAASGVLRGSVMGRPLGRLGGMVCGFGWLLFLGRPTQDHAE
jgi:hypothetical protein